MPLGLPEDRARSGSCYGRSKTLLGSASPLLRVKIGAKVLQIFTPFDSAFTEGPLSAPMAPGA
jgi:hypothetical protein